MNPQKTLTIAGESHSIFAWSTLSGTPYNTIKSRLGRGFSDSAAVFGEKHSKDRHIREDIVRRAPCRTFPLGPLNRWGGVVSINFRRAV